MNIIVFIPGPFERDERFLAYLNFLFPECEIVALDIAEKEEIPAHIYRYGFSEKSKKGE